MENRKWNSTDVAAKVYEKTIQEIFSYHPVSLLAWLKDNDTEVIQKVKYIFVVKDIFDIA